MGGIWSQPMATRCFRAAWMLRRSTRKTSAIQEAKMFQTCGSATLSESGRTINAREESDDHPSVALPLLPRKRYCQAWSVA
jgi:hypothetical protein